MCTTILINPLVAPRYAVEEKGKRGKHCAAIKERLTCEY